MRTNGGIAVGISVAVTGCLLAWMFWLASGDGIVDGKEYRIVNSFKVTIQHAGGRTEEGRQFDFGDRNVPVPSLVVPAVDARGPLVRENQNLKAPAVRRVVVTVPGRTVEGVKYPAGQYAVWEYHFLRNEPQPPPYPVVILKKD